jgi:hypothetical protein
MYDKKAVELSLNTIVIAAIALTILVVLIIIVAGRMGIFTFGLDDCKDKGGSQVSSSAECVNSGGTVSGPYYEEIDGKRQKSGFCCIYSK